MNRIYSVCWNITEKCNENCSFCYRTILDDLDLEDNKKIADKLINHGIEKITFAGGEPLLYKEIFELAKYIKSRNPNILLSLTTNGMLINESNAQIIIDLFDWITFDIESYNEEYHSRVGRGMNHLEKNLQNLGMFSGKINIKINTVATKLNINDIPLIFSLIQKFDVKRWKIFRYYPITYRAKENQEQFMITDMQYQNLIDIISILSNDNEIQIDFNDLEEFKTTYFSVFPDGSLKDNTGNVTCNILTDTIEDCISSIDLSNHLVRRNAFKRFRKI